MQLGHKRSKLSRMGPKIDVEAWQRHHSPVSTPLGHVGFLAKHYDNDLSVHYFSDQILTESKSCSS